MCTRVVQDPRGDFGLVHRVDVDVPASVRDQVDDLVGSVEDPGLLHRGRRVTEAIRERRQFRRDHAAGELDRALHLAPAGDRHDPGKDRDLDTGFAEAVQIVVVDGIVEEHLRGEKIASGIHLLFDSENVLILVGGVGVLLGIAGAADTCLRILLADLFDELYSV